MLNWKSDLTNLDRTMFVANVQYAGLADKKGRTPGHEFIIWRWHETMTQFRCRSHATRAGEQFGGASSAYKDFDTIDQAMEYMESTVAKLEKVTRANKKQFTQVSE